MKHSIFKYSLFAVAATGLSWFANAGAFAQTTVTPTPSPSPGTGWGWHGGGGHKHDHHGWWAEQLGLTPVQKTNIQQIMAAAKADSNPTTSLKLLRESLEAERKNLQSVLLATPVDEAAVRAEAAKVAAIEADLDVQRAYLFAKIQAVLTPDQVAKAKALMAEHGGFFAHEGHEGHGWKHDGCPATSGTQQ